MAIAFGSHTGNSGVSSGGSMSGPTISGTNTLGVVFASGGTNVSGAPTITWGGSAMTCVSTAYVGGSTGSGASICYLKSASSGGSIVPTFTGGGTITLDAAYYTGVDQTTPVETSTNTTGTSTDITASVTTAVNNDWLAGSMNYRVGNTSAGANTTAVSTNAYPGFDSGGARSTGSNALHVTSTSSGAFEIAIIAFSPVPAAGPANLKSFDGNVKANIKSISGNLLANIKSLDGNS